MKKLSTFASRPRKQSSSSSGAWPDPQVHRKKYNSRIITRGNPLKLKHLYMGQNAGIH